MQNFNSALFATSDFEREPKPFAKTPHNIVTVTIDEDGDMHFLKTDSADIFLELGETITRRASHVEPATFLLRIAFHCIRAMVPDTSTVAAWTRRWSCLWRVNTAPVGGPILDGRWYNRQEAIDAEVQFLNEFFLERGIQ